MSLGSLVAVRQLAAIGLVPANEDSQDSDIDELLVAGLLALPSATRVRKISLGVLDQGIHEAAQAQVAPLLDEAGLHALAETTPAVMRRDLRGRPVGLLVPLMSRAGAVDVYVVESAPGGVVTDEQDLLLASALRDQAAAALALRDARARARLDPLTGCLNHGAMHAQMEEELARVQRRKGGLSCVMLDLDGFKAINDERGHPIGDHVVKNVAAALLEECRRYDSCARYGGDEFLVILPDTEIVDAVRAAERMRDAVARWAARDPRIGFGVTITAGVADWRASETADALIERVDKALMAAKAAGKDRVGLG